VPITLSSRFARRTALASAAATLSIALAACSASFSAPTLQPYQAAEGTNVDSGQLKIRNMLVLADAEGKGELHSVIVNDGDTADTLVSIKQAPPGTSDGQAGGDQPTEVTFEGIKEPVDLAPHSALLLPGTGAELLGKKESAQRCIVATKVSGSCARMRARLPGLRVTCSCQAGRSATAAMPWCSATSAFSAQ